MQGCEGQFQNGKDEGKKTGSSHRCAQDGRPDGFEYAIPSSERGADGFLPSPVTVRVSGEPMGSEVRENRRRTA